MTGSLLPAFSKSWASRQVMCRLWRIRLWHLSLHRTSFTVISIVVMVRGVRASWRNRAENKANHGGITGAGTGQAKLMLSPPRQPGALGEHPPARAGTDHPLPHRKHEGCGRVWGLVCDDGLPGAAAPSAFLGVFFFGIFSAAVLCKGAY